MDNDAFKSMVRDRGPSTKDIARAAVEAEFRKRRQGKKRKAGDYSSDSDDEDRRRPKKKESTSTNDSLLFRPTQVKVSEGEASKYRDRAKERRNCGIIDEKSADDGEDAEVPLPVASNGLDMSLVRKERSQLRGYSDEPALSDDEGRGPLPTIQLPLIDQARRNLNEFLDDPSMYPSLSTEESDFLLQYAKRLLSRSSLSTQAPINCGVEGRTLQRIRLVLSMDGHPSDRLHAWEIPRELLQPEARGFPNIQLLKKEVLGPLERFFPTRFKEEVDAAIAAADVCPTNTRATTTHSILTSETTAEPVIAATKTLERAIEPISAGINTGKIEDFDDDDDDIFAGLGDYVPPEARPARSNFK